MPFDGLAAGPAVQASPQPLHGADRPPASDPSTGAERASAKWCAARTLKPDRCAVQRASAFLFDQRGLARFILSRWRTFDEPASPRSQASVLSRGAGVRFG